MRTKSRAFGVAIVLIFSLFSSFVYSATPGAALLEKANAEGSVRIIVHLNINYTTEGDLASTQAIQSQQAQISQAQGNLLNRFVSHNISGVKQFATIPYMAMEVDPAALDALLKDPSISSIEEDIPVPPTLNLSIPFINADDVHTQGFDGSGITVAILDTGVRKTHQFLDAGKVVSEACYSTTDVNDGATTFCPNGLSIQTGPGAGINCSTVFDPGCSHGTHVAGIAAGTDGTPGVGVAPGANVIAIQVFSKFISATSCAPYTTCILSYPSDQMLGLERVYVLRNAYTIAAANMSLGGGQFSVFCDSDPRKAIIDNLRSAGIATIISSGNDSFDGFVGAPACISSAITVGATLNNSNTVASYSNHASMVDMMAPGSDINSSIATGTTSYASWNGTSMAAPHVTGAFAVMRGHNPARTVSNIESALESTGANSTRLGVTKPRIDLLAATGLPLPPPPENDILDIAIPPVLAAIQDRAPPPPPPPAMNSQWGAVTELCCQLSSLTYGVTQSSQSRSSTLSSCAGTATFSGYLTTTPGSKFFSHSVSSSGCGNLVGSGSHTLQSGKRYLWVAEFNSGNPEFVLYSENISSASGNISAGHLSNGGSPDNMVIETSGPLLLEQGGDAQSDFQRFERPRTSR